MQGTRLHIVQFLGIVLLLCGYFMGDQPDRLSMMHFDPNPVHPSVISKANRSAARRDIAQVKQSQNNHPRKSNTPKHISFDLMIPPVSVCHFCEAVVACHASPLPETYSYLFYEEINPPPPKGC